MMPTVMVIILTAIIGCNRNKTNVSTAIDLDTITSLESLPLLADADTPSMEVSINYIFPKEDTLLQKKFNSLMFGDSLSDMKPADAIRVYTKQLGSKYRDDNTSAELTDNKLPSFLLDQTFELNDSIVYSDDQWINILVTNYIEEGGAHGSCTRNFFNISRKNATVVEEQDLFNEGYEDELSKIIVECLLKQLGKQSPSDLESEGFFDSEKIRPNRNFSINEKGLTYCFNEYEIAPYAFGTIYVFIPYERLEPILKQDSPIKKVY